MESGKMFGRSIFKFSDPGHFKEGLKYIEDNILGQQKAVSGQGSVELGKILGGGEYRQTVK